MPYFTTNISFIVYLYKWTIAPQEGEEEDKAGSPLGAASWFCISFLHPFLSHCFATFCHTALTIWYLKTKEEKKNVNFFGWGEPTKHFDGKDTEGLNTTYRRL